ncbi:MAG TPA: hypothetical protein VL523_17350 [Terriglobia bacterium]|nr:hypothetical protein [Terriglobia bacterium]
MNFEWEGTATGCNGLAPARTRVSDGSLAWYKVVGIELGLLGTMLAPLICGALLAR